MKNFVNVKEHLKKKFGEHDYNLFMEWVDSVDGSYRFDIKNNVKFFKRDTIDKRSIKLLEKIFPEYLNEYVKE